MRFGVCIVALGYELYGTYALNLAIGLKIYDPNVQIALLCDSEAIQHLTEEEKKFFDEFVFIPAEDYTVNGKKEYMRVKLMVHRYTPFTHNIYLDADNVWFDKKISWLFGELHDKDFFIGINGYWDVKKQSSSKGGYTYWCKDERKCCEYHGIQNRMPQTVSGFYYFQKCVKTDLIFEMCLKVYDDQQAPCEEFGGGRPDEYCFNVVLGKMDYQQKVYNPIYFNHIHGSVDGTEIYNNFWGIAVGGHRVPFSTKQYYDKLVRKYCAMLGLTPRYHVDKHEVIAERVKN